MKKIKLVLVSKNNKRTGMYLYIPVVKVGNEYFRADSIVKKKPTQIDVVSQNEITGLKKIEPNFYKAWGL